MSRFTFLSLRVRLLLLVLLAVLPALGLILYTSAEQRQLAAAQTKEDALRLVRQASSEQEQLIEGTNQLLAIVAQIPAVRNVDSAACNALFMDLLKKNPLYANIGLINRNGDLQCSAIPFSGPINLGDRAYFQRTLQTRGFAIGDYQIGRITDKPTLNLSFPVQNEAGQIQAVLFAALDLTWLYNLAADEELPPGAILTVIDRNGTILARYPDAEKFVGKAMPEAPVTQAVLRQQGKGTFQGAGVDGTQYLFAFSPLYSTEGEGGVYIYTGIPSKTIFADANRRMVHNLAGLGLVTALVFIIAWTAGNLFLLRRVNILLDATQRLAAGDLSARTGLTYGRCELERLAQSFDKMAGAMEQRTAQLETSNRELENEIIEHKRTKEVLERLNRQNELILSSAGEGIFGIDRHGRTTFVNPAAAKILGFEVEELIDRPSHAIWRHSEPDGSLYPKEKCPFYAAYKDGTVHHGDGEVFCRKNGTSFPVECVSTPIVEQDELVGAVIVFKDVSERKRADAALTKSRDFYLSLFEEFPALIWRSGIDAKCNYFNKSWLRFTGRTMEQEKGDGWAEGVHPGDLDRCVKTYLDAFKAGKPFEMEYRLRRYDGEYRWIIDYGRPFKDIDGNFAGYIGSCYDITERRQAEDALRESEVKYRTIFENTGSATAIVEEDTTISLGNTEIEKITGFTKEEVEGKKSWTEFVAKDDLERLKEYLNLRKTAPDAAPRNYTLRLIDKQGNSKDIYMTIAMIPGTKKSVVSLLDITEHKKAEATIQRRLEYEETIAHISSRFVGVSNIDDVMNASLADMGSLSRASRAYLFLLRENGEKMDNTHEWCAGGVSPQKENLQDLPAEMFPWWMSKLRKGEVIRIVDVAKMPFEAKAEKEILESQGIKSTLALPVNVRGEFAGFIGFDNVIETGEWGSYDLTMLRICSEIVGSAFERKQAEDRIRSDAARASALAEVSQALAEISLDYQVALDTVARRAAELIGDCCFIGLLSDDGQWLNPAAFHNPNPEALTLMRNLVVVNPSPIGEGMFGRVVQTGRPLLVPVVSPDQAFNLVEQKNRPYLERYGIHSILIVPLRVHGRVIGMLSLSRDYPGCPYTPEDQAFLQDLADRVAQAIASARLYSENQRQLQSLSALYTSAQKLGQSLNLQELTEDATRTCVEVFGAGLAWLGYAEATGSVHLLAQYPQENNFLRQIKVRWDESPLGQGAVGRSIRTNSPIIIPDIGSDLKYAPWRKAALEQGFCCTASFPLISRDKNFGALLLYSEQPGFFTQERVHFFQAYAHQAAAALENARLFEEADRRIKNVQALRNIDRAITGSLDLRVTFNVILDQVINRLDIHAACILQLNPHTQTLEYVAGRGFRFKGIQRSRLRLGEGYGGRAMSEKRIISIPNLPEAGSAFLRAPLLAGEDFIAYCAMPLITKGQVKGLLEIFHRNQLDPDQDWLDFLETLAGQAAIAIDNAALFDGLQRSNIELKLAYNATIEGLSYALDLRDKDTEGHSRRVTEMTLRLARAMGMREGELIHVRWGALLHDIGKLGISDNILLKPGPLTEGEWEDMRHHPVYAYEMLSPIDHLRPALDIPYCHHEKWDGTGYPRGLKGEQIPLAARIFAVVDVWDALSSERPYRPAWSEDKVREYIRGQAGKHFDQKAVDVFLKLEW